MLCAPPPATGHPVVCAAVVSTNPAAELAMCVSGITACAATPANSTRARSSRNTARANPRAGNNATDPKPAIVSSRCGNPIHGAVTASTSCFQSRTEGPISARHACASCSPNCAAVASTSCSSVTAVPSSSGCASGAGGSIHLSPNSSSGSDRKNGDATPIGKHDDPTSFLKPGSVSSAVEHAPPMFSLRSNTVTATPHCARVTAAASPFGPEPTILAVRNATDCLPRFGLKIRSQLMTHPGEPKEVIASSHGNSYRLFEINIFCCAERE